MSRQATIKVGDRFDRLEVVEDCGIKCRKEGAKRCHWFKVRCSCGTVKEVVDSALNGGQRSCGCAKSDSDNAGRFQTRHGEATVGEQSLTYLRWTAMRRRVVHHKEYAGVTICARWNLYESFKEDMGECPSDKHTLDRINNDLGYEPDNCRWATAKQQQNNRRCNVRVRLIDGREMTVAEWCDVNGVPPTQRSTVYKRIGRGRTPEEAVFSIHRKR